MICSLERGGGQGEKNLSFELSHFLAQWPQHDECPLVNPGKSPGRQAEGDRFTPKPQRNEQARIGSLIKVFPQRQQIAV
jgi:hypothetical protein